MQLFGEPTLGTDRLQMRGTRGIYAPCQPIEQDHVPGGQLGRIRGHDGEESERCDGRDQPQPSGPSRPARFFRGIWFSHHLTVQRSRPDPNRSRMFGATTLDQFLTQQVSVSPTCREFDPGCMNMF
jgi:hypothetical protein